METIDNRKNEALKREYDKATRLIAEGNKRGFPENIPLNISAIVVMAGANAIRSK